MTFWVSFTSFESTSQENLFWIWVYFYQCCTHTAIYFQKRRNIQNGPKICSPSFEYIKFLRLLTATNSNKYAFVGNKSLRTIKTHKWFPQKSQATDFRNVNAWFNNWKHNFIVYDGTLKWNNLICACLYL